MSEKTGVKTQAKFCKQDFLTMYDGVSIEVFESWIEEIKQEIGWKAKGKQVFPPRVARRIIEHIGQPISLKVLNQ
ncbi:MULTISPECIES: hypothetical protein [Spirosoma]|uniref:hypothetical protein n=1 Tax=Spirosoma TaxID=107 RepID=UPI0009627E8A|nr:MULTISPECIES: hypothetical protein [Spirosoma]MBN8823891.1 hypothetical protein [Spirosoma sp.]OJW79717.1 MAG: hypothetical protein BGO59_00240 [Spirosoma sp. 48-14]